MGFGHVCHLLRDLYPSLATSSSHASWAGSCEGWEESKKGEGMEQEPQEHHIQNTLNAAWRLNAAELVLPFTGREPAIPALLTTSNCSSLCTHTTAQAGGPTPLLRQLQLEFLQHRFAAQIPTALGLVLQQVPWGKWDTSFSLSSCKTRLLPYITGYKQVSTLIQKASWYWSDPHLKKKANTL